MHRIYLAMQVCPRSMLQMGTEVPAHVQIIIFDVKPANILLDEACITAKVTDVGLAKVIAGSNTETLLVRLA